MCRIEYLSFFKLVIIRNITVRLPVPSQIKMLSGHTIRSNPESVPMSLPPCPWSYPTNTLPDNLISSELFAQFRRWNMRMDRHNTLLVPVLKVPCY